MKKTVIALCAAAMASFLFLTSCNQGEIDSILDQIDGIESNEIATLKSQMANITSSISSLQAVDDELQGYISKLQEQQANLAQAKKDIEKSIEDLKNELGDEISTAEANVLAQLEEYKTSVSSQLSSISDALAALQAKDEALQQQISTLKDYVEKELKAYVDSGDSSVKDWVAETFVTLEQYNTTAGLVAEIQTQITALNDRISALEENPGVSNEELMAAIAASEASMKEWINSQLTGYYTIAQTDAKIAELKTSLEGQLASQKTYLEGLISGLEKDLTQKIDANAELMEQFQEELSSLNSNLEDLGKTVADNSRLISENAEAIAENAQGIATNASDIETCEGLIAENKRLIQENADAISDNATAIAALQNRATEDESLIADNASAIAQNAKDIAANAQLIYANATAISNNAKAISDNAADIVQLQKDLATARTEITAAYQEAITSAITTLEGKLSGEIASQVDAVNTRITEEVAAINTAIETLTTRVEACETEISAIKATLQGIAGQLTDMEQDITALMSMLQSMVVVPTYSDGSVLCNSGYTVMAFKVLPGDLAAGFAAAGPLIFSMEAVYTQTKSDYVFVDMPVIQVETEGDLLLVTVSGENLSSGFFAQNISANASLKVSHGVNSYMTGYFPLYPGVPVTSIQLNETELELVAGDTKTLTATVLPAEATYKSLTWTSSKPSIVTVTDAGVITAVAKGSATITASTMDGSGTTATCKVTVLGAGTIPVPKMVDLGLSVKWASFNIGASTPEGYGDYYAWGETEPYYQVGHSQDNPCKDWRDGKSAGYSSGSYRFNDNSKYNTTDNKTVLDPEDDVAHELLDNNWRMPTYTELTELKNNCTVEEATLNGVYGIKFTSKIEGYTDRWIFLPAAGYRVTNGLHNPGKSGAYWFSSDHKSIAFSSGNYQFWNYSGKRYYGFSIRPVSEQNTSIPVSSIQLSESHLDMERGETKTLTATTLPNNALHTGLIWTSSNTKVATVTSAGAIIVTALAVGSATITATTVDGSDISATCEVTVSAQSATPVPEAVDLGLSVKWASFNLGATAPEEFGDYYAWGEIEPYYEDGYGMDNPCNDWRSGKTAGYNWASYTWCDGSYNSITKYNDNSNYGFVDNKTVLDPEDDAAHVKLGGNWRMPTLEEINELLNEDNCKWQEATINGVTGRKVTSLIEGHTNSWIFIPAAGYRQGNELRCDKTGYYRDRLITQGSFYSSSRSSFSTADAPTFGRYHDEDYGYGPYLGIKIISRYIGLPIRPVKE